MSLRDVARLGEVATIARKTIAPEQILDGTTYIGLENIERGGALLNIMSVGNGDLASTKFEFTAEQVLFGKLRPYLAKVARPAFGGVCSTDILPITPGPRLDKNYLAQYLLAPDVVALAAARATGANLPRLSPGELAKFEIPMPPLDEQRKIAAILDHADALRNKRREALVYLDDLTQSIFLDMFGHSDELPRQRLAESVVEFRYGTSNKSEANGHPALRIPNVLGGTIDISELKLVPVADAEYNRLRLVEGDMLFVRTNGNPDNVGRCAVFTGSAAKGSGHNPDHFIYASYLIRARLDMRRSNPVFVREFMLGVTGRRQLRDRSRTSAGQYNINIAGIGSVELPEVPLARQEEFAVRVAGIEKSRLIHRAHLKQLETLFASLQSQAFGGELLSDKTTGSDA